MTALLAGLVLVVGCGSDAAPSSTSQPGASRTDAHPNIVVILADDLRWDTLGFEGHPYIKTPAIDRLAQEGVVFRNSFVITPLCVPARATLFTGVPTYPHGLCFSGQRLPDDAKSFVPLLKQAGYETAMMGKYGLAEDSDPKLGFDHWVVNRKPDEGGPGDNYDHADFRIDGEKTEILEGHCTDALIGFAEDWIHRPRSQPFFLLLSLKNVHVPCIPPERHAKLYADVDIPLPASHDDPYDAIPQVLRDGNHWNGRPLILAVPLRRFWRFIKKEHPDDPEQELIRRYWRMIPSIDEAVAAVVAALEKEKKLDNTVIIFTSDNGFLLGEHGILGKELAYEDSIRVPLVIYDPRSGHAGRTSAQPVLNTDWAPTILDIAGVAQPEWMTGRSVLPLLNDDDPTWRKDWLMVSDGTEEYPRPSLMAVWSADWKYIRYVKPALAEQLFNLKTDRDERHDLIADPAYAQTLDAMRARMRELMHDENIPAEWWEPFDPATTPRPSASGDSHSPHSPPEDD